MLQNDTCIFFLSFHSTSCLDFETLDAEKKKHWGTGECDSSSEGDEREQNWSNETGFNQMCLFLIVAFVRLFLRLPSVAVTWFRVVKSRWWGGRPRLSGSPLVLCISSSFPLVFIVSLGAGLCVVGWRVGPGFLNTGTLLSSQRASGSTRRQTKAKWAPVTGPQ